MNSSIKVIGALAALASSSLAFAQVETPTEASVSPGLLGRRYAELGFAYTDVIHSATDAYGLGAAVNVPVTSYLDVGASYAYGWAEAHSDFDTHGLAVSATAYQTFDAVKAFGSLSLGYQWLDQLANQSVWGADVGVEYDVSSKISVQASVGYSSDFKAPSDDDSWDLSVRANYWVTDRIATDVNFSWLEGGSTLYGVGIVFAF